MSARTYLCLDCRWARRAEAAYGLVTSFRCPSCQGALWELEHRWRIPRKANDRGWKELKEKVSQDTAAVLAWRQRTGAARLARLDTQIANLQKQRDSERKTVRVRKLLRERSETIARYALAPDAGRHSEISN